MKTLKAYCAECIVKAYDKEEKRVWLDESLKSRLSEDVLEYLSDYQRGKLKIRVRHFYTHEKLLTIETFIGLKISTVMNVINMYQKDLPFKIGYMAVDDKYMIAKYKYSSGDLKLSCEPNKNLAHYGLEPVSIENVYVFPQKPF